MKSPDIYQHYFEIQNGSFVDNGNTTIVSPVPTESIASVLKKNGLVLSGVLAGILTTLPIADSIYQTTSQFKDPADALKVGMIAAAGSAIIGAGMLGGAGLAEFVHERYIQGRDRITATSRNNFIQSQIWPKY